MLWGELGIILTLGLGLNEKYEVVGAGGEEYEVVRVEHKCVQAEEDLLETHHQESSGKQRQRRREGEGGRGGPRMCRKGRVRRR